MALPVKQAAILANLVVQHWDKIAGLVDKVGVRGRELDQLRHEVEQGREQTLQLSRDLEKAKATLVLQQWISLIASSTALISLSLLVWMILRTQAH